MSTTKVFSLDLVAPLLSSESTTVDVNEAIKRMLAVALSKTLAEYPQQNYLQLLAHLRAYFISCGETKNPILGSARIFNLNYPFQM